MNKEKLILFIRLMRLNRPIGIFLLLWPTLWALWIASDGWPAWLILIIFVAGTIVMRSAGCVINDYIDRDIDPYVTRTQTRPLADGSLKPKVALYLTSGLVLIGLLLILPLNKLTQLLSLLAVCLAVSYPLTKRFLAIPQAYLGITFSFGIPMAFAAVQNTVPMVAWWLFGANLLWVIAYDTEYALTDKADDIKIGIKTAAITFGDHDIAAIMTCQLGFISLMSIIGYYTHLTEWYFLGLAVALGLILYQYQMIRRRLPGQCLKAFKQNSWVGCAIFVGTMIDYQLR